MAPKRMTLEDLAGMVQREFADIRGDISFIKATMVTKDDIKDFVTKLDLVKMFDDFEGRIIYRYDTQFEKIRNDMRIVKTKLGLK